MFYQFVVNKASFEACIYEELLPATYSLRMQNSTQILFHSSNFNTHVRTKKLVFRLLLFAAKFKI